MIGRLKGQKILVTGAGRGLGAAFSKAIAREGGSVLGLGRNQKALEKFVKSLPGCGHESVVADITDRLSLKAALSGRLFTGLVNNAGVAITGKLHDSTPEQVQNVISTNVLGSLWVIQESLPAFRNAGGGVVVNIASVLGHRPLSHTGIYSASKAAIIQMTRSAAIELARENIRVNALAPGYVITDLNREFLESNDGLQLKKRIALKRFAIADEIVPSLLFLLDPLNGYMTGETITVDGGMSAGL